MADKLTQMDGVIRSGCSTAATCVFHTIIQMQLDHQLLPQCTCSAVDMSWYQRYYCYCWPRSSSWALESTWHDLWKLCFSSRSVIDRLQNDTLLVVMGDHGMTDTGDHGGESQKETDAAIFLYSPSPMFHGPPSQVGRMHLLKQPQHDSRINSYLKHNQFYITWLCIKYKKLTLKTYCHNQNKSLLYVNKEIAKWQFWPKCIQDPLIHFVLLFWVARAAIQAEMTRPHSLALLVRHRGVPEPAQTRTIFIVSWAYHGVSSQ